MTAKTLAWAGPVRWWLGALAAALVPEPTPLRARALRLQPTDEGFHVVASDGVVVGRLSDDRPDPRVLSRLRRAERVYLDLGPEWVLDVEASLPMAAEADLREAVALRLAELTPFQEDEVLFDVGNVIRRADERLQVCVFVTPRQFVDAQVLKLADARVRIDAVVAAHAPAPVPDFMRGITNRRAALRAGRLAVLAFLLVAALGTVLGLVVERQDRIRVAYRADVAALLANVRAAEPIEREIAQKSRALAAARWRRSRGVPLLEILDTIAARLPDSIHLISFRWRDGEVAIAGEARDATAVIELLERAPILADVRFTSPVSRDLRAGVDRFNVAMTTRVAAEEP